LVLLFVIFVPTLSALVDTDFVLGVDCDSTALALAASNVEEMEMKDRVSLIQAIIPASTREKTTNPKQRQQSRGGGRGTKTGRGRGRSQVLAAATMADNMVDDAGDNSDNISSFPLKPGCVDTVLTNPPFGTKPDKAGVDVQFLRVACRLARRAVYSFHKSSTREYIVRTAQSLPNVGSVTVVAEMKFDLPRSYKFHQQKSVDVDVDLIRVVLLTAGENDHIKNSPLDRADDECSDDCSDDCSDPS
jgi:predicted RNA methylase